MVCASVRIYQLPPSGIYTTELSHEDRAKWRGMEFQHSHIEKFRNYFKAEF